MPDAIEALQRLGVSIASSEANAFRGIRFVGSGVSVEAPFPRGTGLGVRRTNLHRTMVEHAERAGVQFLWGTVVTGLHAEGVLVQGKLVRARWTVGADGTGSLVRRWCGLDLHCNKNVRFAFRRHYRIAPWSQFMELHWGIRSQLYITPVGAEEICVVLISPDPGLRVDEALTEFPEVVQRLHGAAHGSVERGAISVSRRLARVCTRQVALIGDASGGVDSITGEGLCLAFNQADLLGECMASGSLSSYHKGHRRLSRRAAMMARLMLVFAQHEQLRNRVMRAFHSEPKLFANLLSAHVGAVSTAELAANAVALGWKLLKQGSPAKANVPAQPVSVFPR
jgi:flavin-dependent dehydrogenase